MKSIKLHELTLRNFKSYGNNITTIKLDGDSVTLIIGKNYDASINGQSDSNGSGKTTILDGISYCCYDKTISKISKDDLINNINKKNMEVSLVLEPEDGTFYRIIRFRKNKERGGNGISIYKGSSLEEVSYDNLIKENDQAEAGTADAQIEKIIGIPYDIFSRIVIFSATHEPFLSLPASSTTNKANQRDIIEELLGLTEISEKAEVLKKSISEDNKEIATLVKVEEELKKQRDKLKDQLSTIENRIVNWDDDKNIKLLNLNQKLETLSNIDFDNQLSLLNSLDDVVSNIRKFKEKNNINRPMIASLKDKISKSESWDGIHEATLDKLKNQIDSFELIDFDGQIKLLNEQDDLNKIIVTATNELNIVTKEAASATRASSKAADEIEHLQDNKCPYCKQQFADVKDKLNDLDKIIADNYVINNNAIKAMTKHSDTLSRARESLQEISSKLKFKQIDSIHKEKTKRQTIINEYESKSKITNPYADDDIGQLRSEYASLEKKTSQITSILEGLSSDEIDIKKKLQFNDKVELEKSKNKVEQLKIDIDKEQSAVNPHLSTYEDMKIITVDDSNSEKIDDLNNYVLHKNFVYKLLTKSDSFIRKSLLIDRLKLMNEKLREYLDVLGLPHKVEFTEELDARISQFGNELDYNNLSSGQKARVNIALAFAFRDVLQKRYGKLNFCILDECLDVGLSNVGVTQAVHMIKQVATKHKLSMFVISHRDEIASSFNNILEIELRNGFSEIVN